jgi:hypothetical protein
VLSVDNILRPRNLPGILLLAMPFMILDFIIIPFVMNVDFMYEIIASWRIPIQLLLITGCIFVFILNLTFLNILRNYVKVTSVTESKIIYNGAKVYVLIAGLIPCFIEIVDLVLLLLDITAFPAVIFDIEYIELPAISLLTKYKFLILMEFFLRDLFFTINLSSGIFICLFFAISIYRWRKLLGKKRSTITIMIPGYLCLGLVWLVELIKVNLLYLLPIIEFIPPITQQHINIDTRTNLVYLFGNLDIIEGGALAITVICGILTFIPVFNQLTEGSETPAKKIMMVLVLASPFLLIFTMLSYQQVLSLGSGIPRGDSLALFLFFLSIFLPLFLVGISYYLIGKNLKDDYLKNFMYTGSICALAFPWIIGIPEPEVWFGTVFSPFIAVLTIGCIYLAGVMAGVNSSVMENVRQHGMEIKFLADAERAVQIENLARETEKVLKRAVEEIKEKTKVTPQINPHAYMKAFRIGILAALNEVDLDQDVDSYINEALELYAKMQSDMNERKLENQVQ